ncbi:hypothetical protein EMIHUDRAFT_53517, partial [Emiliania huxleyi CCMP1516]|uniref:Regulator of chromosome condensation n=2 Tax=Emiliania huxleyi TaxID=2903 RepID=A0A0D3I0B5_EMIH1
SQVACGGLHTWVLCKDGKLFSRGCNDEGQLGRQGDTWSLQEVTGLPSDVVASQVACGSNYTWVLCDDGRLFSCGHNQFGQLGHSNTYYSSSFTLEEVDVSGLDGAMPSQVACGNGHTWVLCKGGRLFSCGDNGYGQLGRTGNKRLLQEVECPDGAVALQVACGGKHTCVLCEGGRLFSCG